MTSKQMISYRNQRDAKKNSTRFIQYADDPVPAWAVDISPFSEVDDSEELSTPDMAAKIEKQDKLIAELLESLEAIATGRDKDGMKVDFPQDIALAAIAKATE